MYLTATIPDSVGSRKFFKNRYCDDSLGLVDYELRNLDSLVGSTQVFGFFSRYAFGAICRPH